jgi:hypothetical protein
MAAPQDDPASLPEHTLTDLAPGQRQQLAALIRSARRLQEEEYATAFDKALSHVPALLRGTIRKMITG